MRFRNALVAAGAALAVAAGPIAFPGIASATPVQQPNLYSTDTNNVSSGSQPYDFVNYNGVTYFSVRSDNYGRAIYSISAPGATPQLVSHTDGANWDGYSTNIAVNSHYLFYTNAANGVMNQYVVDLNTNTTTQMASDGVISNSWEGAHPAVSIGTNEYLVGNDSSHSNELFSFDTTTAVVTDLGTISSIASGLTALGTKLYFNTNRGKLAYFDTADNSLNTSVPGFADSRDSFGVSGNFNFNGQDGIIVQGKPWYNYWSNYYQFVAQDGTVTPLGSWQTHYSTAFINYNGKLYAYPGTDYWSTHYIAEVGADGSLTNLNSVVTPDGGDVRMVDWKVIAGKLVFVGSVGTSHDQYIFQWDGSGAATRISDTHSKFPWQGGYGDFFNYSANTSATYYRELGMVGNVAIANIWLDDSIGMEPYEFGLDGSVTLMKDFTTFSNGLQPGFRCSTSLGNTDYITGTTPSIDPAKQGATLVTFKAGQHSLSYSVSSLGEVSYPCGFASSGSDTYFVGYSNTNWSNYLYKIDASGNVTPVVPVSSSATGPAVVSGGYYYYTDYNPKLHRVDLGGSGDTLVTGDLYDDGLPISSRNGTPLLVGTTLYFAGRDNSSGNSGVYALDTTDPNATPVNLTGGLVVTDGNFMPNYFTLVDGKVVFTGTLSSAEGASLFSIDPADNSVTKAADTAGAVDQFTGIVNVAGTLYVNSSWDQPAYYKYTPGGGLEPLSLSIQPYCLTSTGNQLAATDSAGNIYLYDNSGNLQKEIDGLVTADSLCNSMTTDHGVYISVPEYKRGGDNLLGNEVAFLGTLTPVAVSRFGATVTELPSLPYTGDLPVVESTVPGAPSNVVATAGDSVINLTWDAPTTGGTARTYSVASTTTGPTCTVDGTSAVCSGATAGKTYSFKVKALNGAGSSSWSANSAGVMAPIVAAVPTITGMAAIGKKVTASVTGWSAKSTFTYQWYRDGVAIAGATAKSYVIADSDLNHSISVKVTGNLAGVGSNARTGNAVKAGSVIATLSGKGQVGKTLKVNPGVWPSGYQLSYQWYANKEQLGASGPTYTISPWEVQYRIYAKVVGTKAGSPTIVRTTNSTGLVLLGKLDSTPTPNVYGDPYVYGWLCADSGNWDNNVDVRYQWYRNGRPIDGRTDSCYYPNENDYYQMITVKTTGSKQGYIPKTVTSLPTRIVAQEMWGTLDTPIISGDAVVGSTLTVDPGNAYSFGAYNVTYQWLDTGRIIKGATESTYTIPAKKLGHRISVQVTASRDWFRAQKATSERTVPVTN